MLRAYIFTAIVLISGCSRKEEQSRDNTDSLQDSTQEEVTLQENATDDNSGPAEDVEGCIFDLSEQTSDFLDEIPEFNKYIWNDSTKTATIHLNNGDSLFIKRGGCNHYEVAIRYITKEDVEVMDTAYWLNKAKWFASKIYAPYERDLIDSLIANRIYTMYNQTGDLQVVFEGDHGFSEFYEYVSPTAEGVQMELVYYFD